MKYNNLQINKYENELILSSHKDDSRIKQDINKMNNKEIKNIKVALNKLRNISNILKEKNAIIDGMLLSTKSCKKILSQEILDKESELLEIENDINIYFNKLFSDYIHTDNDKNKILSKLKLIKEELTQRKYIDYLNKKIMVEQKEDKIQKELSKLSTDQLEEFNKQIFNDKQNTNFEIMKKHYEDIKKNDIYHKIFSEIKGSLYNEKNNNNSQNINIKIIDESSNYFQPHSIGNSGMRSEMFSNKKKKRVNLSMDTKYNKNNNIINDSHFNIDDLNKNQLLERKKFRNKSFVSYNYENKKKNRFNSKLFNNNNII